MVLTFKSNSTPKQFNLIGCYYMTIGNKFHRCAPAKAEPFLEKLVPGEKNGEMVEKAGSVNSIHILHGNEYPSLFKNRYFHPICMFTMNLCLLECCLALA